jgi:hypothetical protein
MVTGSTWCPRQTGRRERIAVALDADDGTIAIQRRAGSTEELGGEGWSLWAAAGRTIESTIRTV